MKPYYEHTGITIYRGDCLEILPTLPAASVDLVVTDIPYAEVNQKSAGLRLLDRGNANECAIPLERLVSELVRVCRGSFYVFCGTQQVSPIIQHFKAVGLTTRLGAWEKTNPSPMNGSRLWLSGLEFCVFARKANAVFTEHCKKALWQAPSGRAKTHPTEKPLRLMERLVLASSNPGDTVLDNCMGSGTTGVACVNTGRSFIGIEIEERYCEIAANRLAEAETRSK